MCTDLRDRIRALSHPLSPKPTDQEPRLDPLPGIRAVLFDIYGTLVISASGDIGLAGERDEDRAFRAALAATGWEDPRDATPGQLKATIRAFHAERRAQGIAYPEVDIREMWRRLFFPEGATPDQEARIERFALEYECRVNPVWPMPGFARLLGRLARRTCVLGIVSNAQFYTPLMVEAFLERSLEEAGFFPPSCVFSYRLLEAKPSVRLYETALEPLRHRGIGPDEILYVGNDRRNDIWPAARLGFRTALFAGDRRSLRLRSEDPECAQVQPDRILTHLDQIDALLGS